MERLICELKLQRNRRSLHETFLRKKSLGRFFLNEYIRFKTQFYRKNEKHIELCVVYSTNFNI